MMVLKSVKANDFKSNFLQTPKGNFNWVSANKNDIPRSFKNKFTHWVFNGVSNGDYFSLRISNEKALIGGF